MAEASNPNIYKSVTGSYPKFASLLVSTYTNEQWQEMKLIPWKNDQPVKLSEVYTEMEMESYEGRDRKRVATPLNDYKDLFKNLKKEGNRILAKGDPGIGKTTFTQKLAYDWATGNLGVFDAVFVTKLKFADKDQSIESMIKYQIGPIADSTVSDELLRQYLKSGEDRVLLVLDGLDEIDLKEYPRVLEILRGEAYRKCCILATTRPYIAETLQNKMTLLSKIKGFSRIKAEEFIGRILDDQEERENFFQQVESRKMSEMYRTPIILQALALLYHQNRKLPKTYTHTYDELAYFLRKTYESKSTEKDMILTVADIEEAMNDVNELAFKGLTRTYRQLVFSREEIKNDNIYKLGLLTAEKVGSGFRPKTVLQFFHKTVQEHSAADHVVKRLLQKDRGPWDAILKKSKEDTQPKLAEMPEIQRQQLGMYPTTEPEGASNKAHDVLKRALQKLLDTFSSHTDINATMKDVNLKIMNSGAFEDEINVAQVLKEISTHPVISAMAAEEKEALTDFFLRQGLMQTSKEWRKHQKRWLNIVLIKHPQEFNKYLMDQRDLFTWVQRDPLVAKDIMVRQTYHFDSEENQPYQYITQDFTHLLEAVENNKTLFRFVVGKLSKDVVRAVVLEIAVLVVQRSFDRENSGVLPFDQLSAFMEDLLKENKTTESTDKAKTNLSILRPAMIQFTLEEEEEEERGVDHTDISCTALKISGKMEDDASFIAKVKQQLNGMTSVYTAEIDAIAIPPDSPPDVCRSFTEVLYQSPLVCLEVKNVDPALVEVLMLNLPESMQRLRAVTIPPKRSARGYYRFPQVVNLTCLYLEYCINSVEHMFGGNFPYLKKLSIRDDSYTWEKQETFHWQEKDASVLKAVVAEGRMPSLEYLCIRYISLKGFGRQLAETIKQPTIKVVDFVSTDLSLEDGHILLENVKEGNLDHLESLNLLNNPELSAIAQELKAVGNEHDIHIDVPLPKE